MLTNKEKKILENIKNEKKEFIDLLVKENVIPKDFFTRINKINKEINDFLIEINNSDTLDVMSIIKFINKLILDKVYLNKITSSTNFLKWKFNLIKSQTKLKLQKDLYNDGKIPKEINDILLDKMDNLNSYYNIILDIITKAKDTKDLLDTTIVSLQSIMKNVSFEYINANNINK